MIGMVLSGQVESLTLTHKDCLLRFGSKLIFKICESFGTEVILLDDPMEISPKQELTQDVITLMNVFSARHYGMMLLP
ncbi:MAG: hypothetical protein AB8C84_13110 [Oligoflexales bacterium]